MGPVSAFIKWGVIGTFVAGVLVFAQALEVGDVTGLLQVGEVSELRPIIEEQLGEIPLADGPGHDGQIFYAIGLDLSGSETATLLDHGTYRYRRILYPAVASLGGVLDGHALLYSMITLAVVSMGLAAGAIAAMAVRFDRSEWFALAVILNPGIWLSVRLLTADITALAAMGLGLLAVVSGWRYVAALLAASVLAKDVYLLSPAGLMVHRETRRWTWFIVPAAALAMWSTYLTLVLEGGFSGGQANFSWPFQGIVRSVPLWSTFDGGDLLYLSFALASVIVGLIYGVLRPGWLRWPIVFWSFLGLVSSNSVWDFGNNAARAFAPIVVLIGAAEVSRSRNVTGVREHEQQRRS